MKQQLLNTLRQMEEPDLYAGMYVDYLTGALNRRAFDTDPRPFVAILDLDSLKYVNDTYGYQDGNLLLKTVARLLTAAFDADSVYRLHGDEFAVKSDHAAELRTKLMDVRRAAPYLSMGLGLGIQRADVQLKEEKRRRELAGLRAKRGDRPHWADVLWCAEWA